LSTGVSARLVHLYFQLMCLVFLFRVLIIFHNQTQLFSHFDCQCKFSLILLQILLAKATIIPSRFPVRNAIWPSWNFSECHCIALWQLNQLIS